MRINDQVKIISGYRSGLFASRKTIDEALDYVYSLHDAAATTAAHVVLNTVIEMLREAEIEDIVNVLNEEV